MQILSNPLPLILFILFAALHFVPPLFASLFCKIIRYANICLHILLYFVFMLYRIPLDEVVLLFLVSLLLYVLSSSLFEKIGIRRKKNKVNEEEMP